MTDGAMQTIRISAALIDDENGRLLLVRKAASQWFMQPGGKIENGESPLAALRRELREEIGLAHIGERIRHLGRFSAQAANEPGHIVEADIFHLRARHVPRIGSEIAESVWLDPVDADQVPLAPLTREHVLPLSATL